MHGNKARKSGVILGWVGALACCIASSHAQVNCNSEWMPDSTMVVSQGFVRALHSFQTAGGTHLIVGGNFQTAGNIAARSIAQYDVETESWTPFADGLDGTVNALAVLPTGDVIAGGSFVESGGVQFNRIARWNGQSWTPLASGLTGGGLSGNVNALAVLPNGNVVAAGGFDHAGEIIAYNIAQWNGVAWSRVGSYGVDYGIVRALTVRPNGELIAGGTFRAADNTFVNFIAKFHDGAWHAMGDGFEISFDQGVHALAVTPTGDVIAGGAFRYSGVQLVTGVARWDGSRWNAMGNGINTFVVKAIEVLPDGTVYAGGHPNTAFWNGHAWQSHSPDVNNTVYAVASLSNHQVAFGGAFQGVEANPVGRLIRFGVPDDCSTCDPIDFNNDTSLFDPQDIEAFLSVYSEGPCVPASATCNDIDFNNDTSLFDPCVIDSFLLMYSEGPCTPCGV